MNTYYEIKGTGHFFELPVGRVQSFWKKLTGKPIFFFIEHMKIMRRVKNYAASIMFASALQIVKAPKVSIIDASRIEEKFFYNPIFLTGPFKALKLRS